MALFNQRVGELRSPTASLEALQEINTICNDIALSQPALEALFDLPNLASQFNQTNSAPSVAMLEFVTQQKYETLGMEDFSVATEGIGQAIKDGVSKAFKYLAEMATKIKNWVTGFFGSKPEEKVEAAIEKAKESVKEAVVTVNTPAPKPNTSVKEPTTSHNGNTPSESGSDDKGHVEPPSKEELHGRTTLLNNLSVSGKAYAALAKKYRGASGLLNKLEQVARHAALDHSRQDDINKIARIMLDQVHSISSLMISFSSLGVHISHTATKLGWKPKTEKLDTDRIEKMVEGIEATLHAVPKYEEIETLINSSLEIMNHAINVKGPTDEDFLTQLRTRAEKIHSDVERVRSHVAEVKELRGK